MRRELKAAGIDDPLLRAAYARCRRINAKNGKTYYLATLLLPAHKRPFVHALYGFARYIDDIVDDVARTDDAQRALALSTARETVLADLATGFSRHPIFAATVDTAQRWNIPTEYFEAFLHSMQLDLTVRRYESYSDLESYMYGSAAVIGLMMIPILEPTSPDALGYARDLGFAFQLANFIRDIAEDLDRDRIYLPLDELAKFEVTPHILREGRVTPDVRDALAFQVDRVRELSESAARGIKLLDPACQPCIATANALYCGIVDEVELAQYDVFSARVSVPIRRRVCVALPAWRAARRARDGLALHSQPTP